VDNSSWLTEDAPSFLVKIRLKLKQKRRIMLMGRERKEIKCPWCGNRTPISEMKARCNKNDYGTVVERRCACCNRVLAAYLEEEGEFLSKIRTF